MLSERYESFQLIGEGGVGKVYRAFDRSLNRPVAIKRIKSGNNPQNDVDDLLAEARTLCRVQHPNIVTIYDVGRELDEYFIVMELIDGENFEMLSRHGKMLYEQFCAFAIQTQEGLIAAHQLGILHRDIKPANVMLVWLPSGSLHIKIVDFGLAQLATEALKSDTHLVKPDLAGSLHFMSPEQFERQPLDVRSDLYSLGCLYYFGLTQRYPFAGDSSLEVMVSHIQNHVVPLQQIRPDLPAWLCEWVMWHIQRQPYERPTDAMAAFLAFKKNAGVAYY
jgi:serine/threonine protein kinase